MRLGESKSERLLTPLTARSFVTKKKDRTRRRQIKSTSDVDLTHLSVYGWMDGKPRRKSQDFADNIVKEVEELRVLLANERKRSADLQAQVEELKKEKQLLIEQHMDAMYENQKTIHAQVEEERDQLFYRNELLEGIIGDVQYYVNQADSIVLSLDKPFVEEEAFFISPPPPRQVTPILVKKQSSLDLSAFSTTKSPHQKRKSKSQTPPFLTQTSPRTDSKNPKESKHKKNSASVSDSAGADGMGMGMTDLLLTWKKSMNGLNKIKKKTKSKDNVK